MHVAVAGWLLEDGAHSGANRRLHALLREAHAWLRAGERVTVLHRPQLEARPPFEQVGWRAVDIPPRPTWRRAVAEQRTLRPLLRELGATVYDHGFLPTPRVGVPVCQTIHDVRDADGEGEGRRPRWLARAVLRRSLLRAARVLTVSEWTAQRLRALVPGCEPVVVRNGVDAAEPGPRPRRLPARGYVLHVGHLEPRKNVSVLVRALARIDAAARPELWLIGHDAGEWPRLRALAERLGVREDVLYLGPQPDRVLAAYYRGARLVAVPSRHEGYGLPALEARVQGTRVAVADAGALPEIAGDGLVLPVDDAEAWAAAMSPPEAEDPEAIRARASAAAALDWSEAARRWVEALRAVSASRP